MKKISVFILLLIELIVFSRNIYAQNIYGKLVNNTGYSIQANISAYQLGAIKNSSLTVDGNYSFSVTQGIYDLDYEIVDVPNFFIRLLSLNVVNDVKDKVNYVTRYDSNISFIVDSDGETIQLYSEKKPNKISANGTNVIEVSSLSQLTNNTWFYNSTEQKLYLIASPIVNTCSDGTLYNQCSVNKPKYCDNGSLTDRCSVCNCSTGYECQVDGSCEFVSVSSAYIVYQEGSMYYMKNGTTGQIIASGPVAHVVVNWALGNLTPGRTWKEKVVLIGNFNLTGSITPSSYTVLNLTYATLTTNVTTLKMIDFKGTASNHKKYLDIISGHFIGAATLGSGPETHCAIHAVYADYVTITDGLYEKFYGLGEGARGQAIWFGSGSKNLITATIPPGSWINGNWVANPNPSLKFFNNRESYAIAFTDTVDSIIENAYIECGNYSAGVSGTGLWLGGSNTPGLPCGCIFRNNEIFGWNPKGSHAVYLGGSIAGSNNKIISNYIHNEQQHGGTAIQVKGANTLIAYNLISHVRDDYGITVYCEGGARNVSGTQVIGNTFQDVYKGMELGINYDAGPGTVENVTFKDNVISPITGGKGMSLAGSSYQVARNCLFKNNTVLLNYGIPDYGIYFYDSPYDYSEYNQFIGNTISGRAETIHGRGTYSTFINNTGYNPIGPITNPVSGPTLVDSGTGTIANDTLYTCWESPKNISISGGTVSSIQVNGIEMIPQTTVTVQPNQTFKIIWSVAPTIQVVGQ